jgi:hypothetical protein
MNMALKVGDKVVLKKASEVSYTDHPGVEPEMVRYFGTEVVIEEFENKCFYIKGDEDAWLFSKKWIA